MLSRNDFTENRMDPLSDVLTLLDATSYPAPGIMAPEDWGLHFPGSDGLLWFSVLKGGARICSGVEHEWQTLHQGEAVILPGRARFAITTLTGKVRGRAETAPHQLTGNRADYGGDHLILGCGKMVVEPGAGFLLLGELPPAIYLRTGSPVASMCNGLMEGNAISGPGHAAITGHVLQVLMIEGIRGWLARGVDHQPGWLSALRDPRLLDVMSAMHQAPAQNWTLPALAKIAGMSRAGFARRFSTQAGCSPLNYLARWRMHLAGKALRTTAMPVKEIGFNLGYGCESAFSSAFRRIHGCSPVSYRSGCASGFTDQKLMARPIP